MKFAVVYADPAWEYTVYSAAGAGRTASSHYQTQSLETLKQLPVPAIMAEDCILLMWATYPNLPQAFELVEGWNQQIENPKQRLTYRTVAFTWAKTNKRNTRSWFVGLGYYTRANPEICLLFARGKTLPRKSKGVQNLIVAPVGEHSAKPEEAARRIEQLWDGAYVELFARQYRDGWTCLGNELDGLDLSESIHRVLNDEPLPRCKSAITRERHQQINALNPFFEQQLSLFEN